MTTKIGLLALVLGLCAACGDDGTPTDTGTPVDSATDTSTPPTDTGTDADAGTGSGVTFEVTADSASGRNPLEGATVWVRLPDDTLLEETTPASGMVTFDGVDLDAGGLEVTVWKEGHIALSLTGFGRGVIAYHEERGWSADADEGRVQINIGELFDVTLAGTNENGVGANVFIQSLDGFSAQYVGFRSVPWELYMLGQATTTLVAWDWNQEAAVFGERGRRWRADATFLETAADADATGLVLDFATDVPLTDTTISYVAPTGSRFFEDALLLGGLNAANPVLGPGALVGFPTETVFDEATSTVTVTISSPALPVGEAAFLTLQLGGMSANSNVIYPWDGTPPAEALEPDFLVPPSLSTGTASGITFGEAVQWSGEETDLIQSVNYFTVPETGGVWSIQAWGSTRFNARPPELPASVIAGFLPGDGEIGGSVSLCDFDAGICVRDTAAGVDVER